MASGWVVVGTTSNRVAWSRSGTAWFAPSPLIPAGRLYYDVVWDGAQWVAVGTGNGGTGVGWSTSPDGRTWTHFAGDPLVFGAGSMRAIERVGSNYVTWGLTGSTRWTAISTDLVTWTRHNHAGMGTITATPRLFHTGTMYVVGGNGGAVATSPDAITWTLRNPPTTTTFRLDFHAGLLISDTATSANHGVTWTARTGLAAGRLGFSRTGRITMSPNSIGDSYTSTDGGVTWSTITDPNVPLNCVSRDGGRFLGVNSGGTVAISSDMLAWTYVPPGIGAIPAGNWIGIDYGIVPDPDTPPVYPLDPCGTYETFSGAPVPDATDPDGAVVYSSGALDSFGRDRTTIDWPNSGANVSAIEVEVTATDEFTADGQVQVVVCRPDTLTGPISGATSDASGVWSGWDGGVGRYRSSGVDAYHLNKIGGWRTDYTSPSASISTPNTISVGVVPAFGQDWAIEFEARRSSWASSAQNTITGSGTAPLIAATSTGLWIRLAGTYAAWAPTISWAALGAVDGQWLKCRITYSTASRLNVYVDNGAGWTLVATPNIDTPATYTETPTQWGAWYVRVGNGQNASGLPQIGWDGDIRTVKIYAASTLIMDLGLDRMPTSTSYSWATTGGTASWFGLAPSPPPVTGSSISATQRVRWEADTPFPITDVRLIVDAQTGSLTVDEVLIEAECGRTFGVYRDGRLHAT